MVDVTVFSTTSLKVEEPQYALGEGGIEAEKVTVGGEITAVEVAHNGEPAFDIRILEDGSLIITNYQGIYKTTVPQNLRLTPSQPWSSDVS